MYCFLYYFLVEDLLFRNGNAVVSLRLKEQVKLLTQPEASSLQSQQPFHPVVFSILGVNVQCICLALNTVWWSDWCWLTVCHVYLAFAFFLFLFSHKD